MTKLPAFMGAAVPRVMRPQRGVVARWCRAQAEGFRATRVAAMAAGEAEAR